MQHELSGGMTAARADAGAIHTLAGRPSCPLNKSLLEDQPRLRPSCIFPRHQLEPGTDQAVST